MTNQQEVLDALVSEALNKPLFFIGGQGKSGTTWLQLLLNSHPHIACHGEGHFTDVLAPKLHEAANMYNSFLEQNNRLFSEIQHYPLLKGNHLLYIFRHTVGIQLSQHPGYKDARILGERTPANLDQSLILINAFPDANFIHMIRDPRDIAVSFWFHGLRTNPRWIKSKYGSIEKVLNRIVPEWIKGIHTARGMWDKRPHQYQEVLYEELHQNPQSTLEKILNKLGADNSTPIIRACLNEASFSTLSGGRQKGQENTSSHFRKGIIGDWKNHLNKKSVQNATMPAEALFEEFNYK